MRRPLKLYSVVSSVVHSRTANWRLRYSFADDALKRDIRVPCIPSIGNCGTHSLIIRYHATLEPIRVDFLSCLKKNGYFFIQKSHFYLHFQKFALSLHSQSGRKLQLQGSGALVQLVRIRACHARGQGFESPTHRTKEDNRKVVFFFLCLSDDGRYISAINSIDCSALCASPQLTINADFALR